MNKKCRIPVIAGNWKMHNTSKQTEELINAMLPALSGFLGVKVVLCVPFTDIKTAVTATSGTGISIGAQNVHFAEKGAFTGEISTAMLLECGAEYVIIGHSERRQYFGETDETVRLRTAAALAGGMRVILCVGETLDEREGGKTEDVVKTQLLAALDGVTSEQMESIIIAYEPVWAIGTGKNATEEQAQQVCAYIRRLVSQKYGNATASAVIIQYGGSMKASNASALLAMNDIDGGLIGSASLSAEEFIKIAEAAADR